jgi:hypothetical protein
VSLSKFFRGDISDDLLRRFKKYIPAPILVPFVSVYRVGTNYVKITFESKCDAKAFADGCAVGSSHVKCLADESGVLSMRSWVDKPKRV